MLEAGRKDLKDSSYSLIPWHLQRKKKDNDMNSDISDKVESWLKGQRFFAFLKSMQSKPGSFEVYNKWLI